MPRFIQKLKYKYAKNDKPKIFKLKLKLKNK